MGVVAEFLWTPLKFAVEALLPFDLWQYVNPIYAAPFFNAFIGGLIAFIARYLFLRFCGSRKQPRDN